MGGLVRDLPSSTLQKLNSRQAEEAILVLRTKHNIPRSKKRLLVEKVRIVFKWFCFKLPQADILYSWCFFKSFINFGVGVLLRFIVFYTFVAFPTLDYCRSNEW